MTDNVSNLAKDLPCPMDDGAAFHLWDMTLPEIEQSATNGATVNIYAIRGCVVIYVYPMTGQPDIPLPDGWDSIPGARGCIPQSLAFCDHNSEHKSLNIAVFVLSIQTTEIRRKPGIDFTSLRTTE